ncbi:MAG: carboxypeptidase regulatory-like domain-containing protein [Clostridium sp.]
MSQSTRFIHMVGQSSNSSILTTNDNININLNLSLSTSTLLSVIKGNVIDANLAAVASANIKLIDDEGRHIKSVSSDSQGNYIITNIPPSTGYTILVSKAGLIRSYVPTFTLAQGQTIIKNISMAIDSSEKTGLIVGKVFKSQSSIPIGGAVVSVYNIYQGLDTLYGVFLTNTDGQFAFKGAPSGSYNITVAAVGYTTMNLTTSITTQSQIATIQADLVPLALPSSGIISGTIKDLGSLQFISGAEVTLIKINGDGSITPYSNVFTGSGGEYIFNNIPIGNYRIRAEVIHDVPVITESVRTGPFIDKLILSEANTLSPISINTINGVYSGGASTDGTNSYAGLLGSTSDGAITNTINVPVSGIYSLGFKYITGFVSRPLKVTINGVYIGSLINLPSTNGYTAGTAGTYTLNVQLTAGDNTIKFHGDGTNYAPSIGPATLTKSPNVVILATSMVLASGAFINSSSGFINNIGNSGGGNVTATVYVPVAGSYSIGISYYANSVRPMRIDVNGVYIGTEYSFPYSVSTNPPAVYSVTLTLNKGNNTVKFYNGSSTAYAPDIKQIEYVVPQYSNTTEAEATTLSGSAVVQSGFVGGVSGSGNGALTYSVTVPFAGEYDLNIIYTTLNDYNKARVSINGVGTGVYYSFPKTSTLNAVDEKSKVIRVTLASGVNTIKVY